jgi:hypothetical protein
MVGKNKTIGQVLASGNAFSGFASEYLTAIKDLSKGNEGLAVQNNTKSDRFSSLPPSRKKKLMLDKSIKGKVNLG